MSELEISKGENTRQKIIQTALHLAAKHGFGETSFQMIADELDLSQSAVLYHFDSKNALVEELIKTIIRHNHEIVAGLINIEENAGQRLLKHCLGNVLWALCYRRQDAQILILLYYQSCHDKRFTELFTRMIARGRERIMEHLLAGIREGLFHIKDPAIVASALQDCLFGAMLYVTSAPEGSVNQAEIEEKIKLVVTSFTGWSCPPGSVLPVRMPSPKHTAKPEF